MERENILKKYKDRKILEEIFSGKDATNILLNVMRLWPQKSGNILHQLVELYGAHDCENAEHKINKLLNGKTSVNHGNDLFFNKDLLDIMYTALVNLQSAKHCPKLGHTLKFLVRIVIRSDNLHFSVDNLDDTSVKYNNFEIRTEYLSKIIEQWSCEDMPSLKTRFKSQFIDWNNKCENSNVDDRFQKITRFYNKQDKNTSSKLTNNKKSDCCDSLLK